LAGIHNNDRGPKEFVDTVKQLKPFDYASAITGILGTLLILGAFGEASKPLLLFSGIFSALLCLFSMGPLIINVMLRYLEPAEQRLYILHVFVNLAPTVYFLAHLSETRWEKFTC
jgi:hypothetical protein